MQKFSGAPKSLVSSAIRNRQLIFNLIKRDVEGRYRGSYIGLLWPFINPVLMLGVYTYVFGFVFKSKWGSQNATVGDFALILFCGLIIFNFFSECITKAPSLIIINANYVKKVVFPLEILPFVSVGSAGVHAIISLIVWLIAYVALIGIPSWSAILIPIVFLPLVLIVLGMSWLLSSLGVYVRDASQFIGVLVSVMMFLCPIFYPAASLPEEYRWVLYINPVTIVVEEARDVLFFGRVPSLVDYAVNLLISLLIGWGGYVWFQKTRKGFADVI